MRSIGSCILLRLPLFLLAAGHAGAFERQPPQEGRESWHTGHFRIELEAPLARADLERLGRVADQTADAVKNHPLPLFAPPPGRPLIHVAADTPSYEAVGGVKGTAGFYQGRGHPRVILDGFHLRQASHEEPSRLPPRMNDDLIVHEIVHLCMHRINNRLPQWLQEGVAEYVASAHRGDGRFSFRNMDEAVRDHLRARIRGDETSTIVIQPVARLATLDHRGWLAYLESLPPEDRYRAYATALVLAHFHLHGGPERLEALREALLTQPREKSRQLLDPAEAGKIEGMLVRYWKNRGLHLAFRGEAGIGR